MLKIYFDNNAWMRPFQKNSSRSIDEANAVEIILLSNEFEIISSQFQINWFAGTQNSLKLTTEEKDAFAKAEALRQSYVSELKSHDPHCNAEIEEFYKKVQNQTSEDRIHIILAWRKGVNCFITADRELYDNCRKLMEETIASMWHPTLPNHTNEMKILNPVEFVSEFIN